jgi:uncharacterized membrane protein
MNVSSLDTQIRFTHVIYGLYATSLIVGVTAIVAIVLNYLKREEVAGSLLESHFRWQIRTFWFTLLWIVIGFATVLTGVGIPILMANLVWFIYRIARGWLALQEGKPIGIDTDPQD